MKTFAVALAVLACAAPARAQLLTNQGEVERLARTAADAVTQHDAATLGALLAPGYTHVDADGRVLDRDALLKSLPPASVELGDVHATLLQPSVVVLTAVQVVHVRGAAATRERVLEVWVRSDAGWKRRFFQATAVR